MEDKNRKHKDQSGKFDNCRKKLRKVQLSYSSAPMKYFLSSVSHNKEGGNGMETNQDNPSELFQKITIDQVKEYIQTAQETSGYKSTSDLKKDIENGKIKNYSIIQLEMWEEMETLLKELNHNE